MCCTFMFKCFYLTLNYKTLFLNYNNYLHKNKNFRNAIVKDITSRLFLRLSPGFRNEQPSKTKFTETVAQK